MEGKGLLYWRRASTAVRSMAQKLDRVMPLGLEPFSSRTRLLSQLVKRLKRLWRLWGNRAYTRS